MTPVVTLIVLKSVDQATAFLSSLNRWIVGIGAAGVIAGSLLVFLVPTTFTRPLGRLVSGVQGARTRRLQLSARRARR